MKILKVWQDDYPWDVRVEKICKALLGEGHEVHLVCSNKSGLKNRENYEGIQIHRLRPFKNDLLNKVFSMPAFFNPVWLYNIFQVVKQERIKAILVRDLPLVVSALLVSKIYKIPVIFDMAENFPSMWKEHVDKRGFKFVHHLLKNPAVATLLENYVLKRVDHTIVVVEESKERLVKKGAYENKISIVSNTPDLAIFEDTSDETDDHNSDKLEMLYMGSVNGGRGLDIAIKAVPLLIEKLNNFCLIIAGVGEYLEELKSLTSNLGVTKYVNFLGWVDPKLVPSYIFNCDIGVVPHNATDFVNTTIPNKIFDYMACKKPVVVSDAAPLKRIINEADCGVVFKSRDVGDFAEKVIQLENSSIRKEKGINGYLAIKSKYNWKHDSQILKEIFREMREGIQQKD